MEQMSKSLGVFLSLLYFNNEFHKKNIYECIFGFRVKYLKLKLFSYNFIDQKSICELLVICQNNISLTHSKVFFCKTPT